MDAPGIFTSVRYEFNTEIAVPSSLARIRKSYRALAVVFFNTVVLFVALNVVLAIAYAAKDWWTSDLSAAATDSRLTASGLFYENGGAVDNGKRSAGDVAVFDLTAFAGAMREEDVSQMLDENYDCFQRGIEYQPWVQYARKPFSGKFLNIDLDSLGIPIRRTTNPTDLGSNVIRIFTFGGSTTFGLKTPDEQTWPSHLSQILNNRANQQAARPNVEVINYGRAGYMPTQELVLLLDLLRTGHRPNLVIFFDGLNWGGKCDVPDYTYEIRDQASAAQQGAMPGWYQSIPVVRMANSIRSRFRAPSLQHGPGGIPEVKHTEQRFLQSRETILRVCEQYGVQALFFLQPDAYYNYPAHMHRAAKHINQDLQHSRRSEFYASLRRSGGYMDLTGLFEKFGKKCVIDAAHYTPQFNRFIAEHIATEIDLTTSEVQTSSDVVIPTGGPRN